MNIQQLLPQQRILFENHLKRLDWDDRLMRFESSVGDEYIAKYVARIPQTDAIFAAIDATGTVLAAAHVAVVDGTADLGLSVDGRHRRQGLGTSLLGASIAWANAQGLRRFSSQCLSHNRWMTTRMRRMGFTIDVDRETTFAVVALENIEQSFASFSASREYDLLESASYGAKVVFQGTLQEGL